MPCWEERAWAGGGRLPFLLLGSMSVPGTLSGHSEPCPRGRRPQKGHTHRKVAGQELPVLLSELPHQGPQLLILPMPERGLSSRGCTKQVFVTEPSPGTASFIHSTTTYYAPGATDRATADSEGLMVQRETDANPSLPQTIGKPLCWGAWRVMQPLPIQGGKGTGPRRPVQLGCRKQGGWGASWLWRGRQGPDHTLRHAKPLRH